ncbi:efflux RND transporter periplasmic adaptor subunit [Pollutimonas bauzanensis]|uniref:Membrane fusion protein, macrolide-specific efflux system n=1 Tax=Pollutimonas bauzanensis TaxID=658167 RepID=A0A1M5W1N1_9BURK|nr:efflux RND transporter periplasmic adaptor subunit [Pollutimonas bauzanensis]SHH81124.1 membrane fusion protein, macrolide-specific efflux system [Pollutimonas bauzanensis]
MPPRSRIRRFALPPVVLAAFIIILWATFFRTERHIDTVTIGRGNIELTVTALGNLRPRSYVDVGAQASGAIRRIAVQPGDHVQKGQLLVEIDPSIQQAKVDVDQANLAGLKAQLAEQQANRDLAWQQYERQRKMAVDGATRQEDIQTAHAALRVAVASIDNLRAQIDAALSTLKGDQAQLGYTRIYAPMAGTVVTLDAREGQTLNATYQTPTILRIADLSHMTVWTEVSEADIKRVRTGMPVYFTTLSGQTDTGPRRWTGTVRQILPAPPTPAGQDPNTAPPAPTAGTSGKVVLYTVLVDVDNADGALMPQMSAQVFFIVASAENAILAPTPSLQPVNLKQDTYAAKILSGAEVIERKVKIGVHDRLNAQVLSGLSEGDSLVTAIHETHAGAGRFRW